MKIRFSGVGCFAPFLVMGAMALVRVTVGPLETAWTWGLILFGLGVMFLAIEWLLFRLGRRNDSFMGGSYGGWGVLCAIAGIGALGIYALQVWRSQPSPEPEPPSAAICAELQQIMSRCTRAEPGIAQMFGAMCVARGPEWQTACLECVRAAVDPCDPRGCSTQCQP